MERADVPVWNLFYFLSSSISKSTQIYIYVMGCIVVLIQVFNYLLDTLCSRFWKYEYLIRYFFVLSNNEIIINITIIVGTATVWRSRERHLNCSHLICNFMLLASNSRFLVPVSFHWPLGVNLERLKNTVSKFVRNKPDVLILLFVRNKPDFLILLLI